MPSRRVRTEIRYSANDMITNVNLVRAGFAASIVPGFILASLSNSEGLRVVDLPGAPYRSIFTAVRADAVTTPALAMVREAMRYAVSEASTLSSCLHTERLALTSQ